MAFEPATAANSGPMALHVNTTPDALAWLPEGVADRLRALCIRNVSRGYIAAAQHAPVRSSRRAQARDA